MRKQRLLKILNCRGKALAILLTVTASLLYCGSAWATFEGSTYYFDNTQTKWAEVYMIIGKDTYAQARQMTETDCSGIYSYSLSDWSDATKFFFAESTCGFSTTTEQKSIDTTPTCENYTAKITSKPSSFLFVPSEESGTAITGTWSAAPDFAACRLESVLKGEKIMFYLGESSSWGDKTLYLYDSDDNLLCKSSDLITTYSGYRYRYVTAAAGSNYYFTHGDSYKSGLFGSTVPVQGGAYNNGGGASFATVNDEALTASITIPGSVTVGSNVTISDSALSNKILNLDRRIKCYATTDNSTFTELNISSTTLQTSGLATGTWTIIPVYYDGHIYCKGTTTTLTVAPSGDAPTVLLAAEPEVSGANATLHGYLKYTGCQDVTAYGFIWDTDESKISAATPTGTSVAATSPTGNITVGNEGTEFTLTNGEFTAQDTIYYKAYAINAIDTAYSAIDSFSTEGCVKPVVTAIELSPSTICDNTGTITATATAIDGATYAWEVDGSVFTGTVASITNVATITVSAAGTGSISVTPTITSTSCVGSKFTDDDITVKSSAIAAKNLKYQLDGEEEVKTEEGETYSFCQGTSITLKITSDDEVSTYSWTIPASWTVTSGSTSSKSLTATIGASGSSSTISATISNSCGVSDTRTFTANVTPIPAAPGTITGDTTVCKGTVYTYSISDVTAATEYQWVIPAGWTGECDSVKTGLKATPDTSAVSGGVIKVKAVNSCGSSAYNSGLTVTAVKGVNVTITGSGAKSTSATYPWEIFTLTATTDASSVTWNTPTYTGTIASDLTVWSTSGKTATLKSGAPASDADYYTITVTTSDDGCQVTSDGYDVYINAAATEVCE